MAERAPTIYAAGGADPQRRLSGREAGHHADIAGRWQVAAGSHSAEPE
jgi:hypothetical protein